MKDVALVGPSGSGKSTVFAAVARTRGTPGARTNLAAVAVPDERLERVGETVSAVKLTPAQVRLVDTPGGSAQGLGEARAADALAIVLPGFSGADLVSELASFRAELVLADLATIEKSLDRVRKKAKSGDADALREAEALAQAESVLSSERWLADEKWEPGVRRVLELITPLTLKPSLVILNADEGGADVPELGSRTVVVRGLLESEAAELSPDEAAGLLAEFGVEESATARLVTAVYETLDLVTFFTGNEKEARAWEIRRGTKAPQAAGTIHGDFEKGFIRWEAVSLEDFRELGSWDAAREKGKLRVEGREYEVQDGDVVRVRHS